MSVRETCVFWTPTWSKYQLTPKAVSTPPLRHTPSTHANKAVEQFLCSSEAIRRSNSLWTLESYVTKLKGPLPAEPVQAKHDVSHSFNHPHISHHSSAVVSWKWDQWKTHKKWSNFTTIFFKYIFSQIEHRVGASTSAAQEGTKVSKGHSLLKVLRSLKHAEKKSFEMATNATVSPPGVSISNNMHIGLNVDELFFFLTWSKWLWGTHNNATVNLKRSQKNSHCMRYFCSHHTRS